MSQFKNDQKPPRRLEKFRDSNTLKYKFEFKTTLKLSKCVDQIRHWHEKCPDNLHWKFKGNVERIGTSDAYHFRIQRSNCNSSFISELYGSMRPDDFEQKTVIYSEFELPLTRIDLVAIPGFICLISLGLGLFLASISWMVWFVIGFVAALAIGIWIMGKTQLEYATLTTALHQKLHEPIIMKEIE